MNNSVKKGKIEYYSTYCVSNVPENITKFMLRLYDFFFLRIPTVCNVSMQEHLTA